MHLSYSLGCTRVFLLVSSKFSVRIVPRVDVFLMCSWREVNSEFSYSAILSPLHLRNLVSSYYSNLLSSASSPRSLVYVWGLKGADHTCYLVSPPDSEPIQKRNKKPNFVVIHELYCKYSWCLETVACPKPELELPIILPDQC